MTGVAAPDLSMIFLDKNGDSGTFSNSGRTLLAMTGVQVTRLMSATSSFS